MWGKHFSPSKYKGKKIFDIFAAKMNGILNAFMAKVGLFGKVSLSENSK